jgi:hypothetical protein
MREALTNAVAVAYPHPTGLYVLSTDASSLEIGAILQQFQLIPAHPDKQELRILAFASRSLKAAENNYAATKLELLAVVTFVRRYHQYLIARRFILLTDHYALQWLFTSASTSEGIIARWITQLSVYEIAVFYRKGTGNTAADILSRKEYTSYELSNMILQSDLRLTAGKSRPHSATPATQVNEQDYTYSVHELPRIDLIEEVATQRTDDRKDPLLNQIGAFSLFTRGCSSNGETFGLPTDWSLEQRLDHDISYVVRHLNSTEPRPDLNEQPDDLKRLWATHEQLAYEDDC